MSNNMTTNNGVVSSPVNEFTLECHTEQYSELLPRTHTHTKGKEKTPKKQQQQKQRFTLIFHGLVALNVLLGKPCHKISFLHELSC